MKASHKYMGVLNRSLEFSAEDYISARSAWRDCARRMRKLAGFLVTTVLCVGLPVCIVIIFLMEGVNAPPVTTITVRREGIETTDDKGPANFTCLGNVTGMISAEPAGDTADEGRVFDGDLQRTW